MPRGWLKHQEKRVGKKCSRGGSSARSNMRNSSKSSKPPRIVDEDIYDHDFDYEFDYDFEYDYDDSETRTSQDTATTTSSLSSKATTMEEECPICCEVAPLIPLLRNCKHPPACHSCLREIYIHQAQEDVSNYPLRCYHPSCNLVVRDTQLIQHNLIQSKHELQKHYRLSTLQKAYAKPHVNMIVHCPSCDCPHAIRSQHIMKCRNCEQSFAIVREGVTDKYSTFAALDTLKSDKIGINDGWANCPQCDMIISKGDGCDHMICVCGADFLWGSALRTKERSKIRQVKTVAFATSVTQR